MRVRMCRVDYARVLSRWAVLTQLSTARVGPVHQSSLQQVFGAPGDGTPGARVCRERGRVGAGDGAEAGVGPPRVLRLCGTRLVTAAVDTAHPKLCSARTAPTDTQCNRVELLWVLLTVEQQDEPPPAGNRVEPFWGGTGRGPSFNATEWPGMQQGRAHLRPLAADGDGGGDCLHIAQRMDAALGCSPSARPYQARACIGTGIASAVVFVVAPRPQRRGRPAPGGGRGGGSKGWPGDKHQHQQQHCWQGWQLGHAAAEAAAPLCMLLPPTARAPRRATIRGAQGAPRSRRCVPGWSLRPAMGSRDCGGGSAGGFGVGSVAPRARSRKSGTSSPNRVWIPGRGSGGATVAAAKTLL
eukprot:352500-Chlamydomonas_euryale.AAC.2